MKQVCEHCSAYKQNAKDLRRNLKIWRGLERQASKIIIKMRGHIEALEEEITVLNRHIEKTKR